MKCIQQCFLIDFDNKPYCATTTLIYHVTKNTNIKIKLVIALELTPRFHCSMLTAAVIRL